MSALFAPLSAKTNHLIKRCEILQMGLQSVCVAGGRGKVVHLGCILMSEQQQMDKNGERGMESSRKARLFTQAPPPQQWCMMAYEWWRTCESSVVAPLVRARRAEEEEWGVNRVWWSVGLPVSVPCRWRSKISLCDKSQTAGVRPRISGTSGARSESQSEGNKDAERRAADYVTGINPNLGRVCRTTFICSLFARFMAAGIILNCSLRLKATTELLLRNQSQSSRLKIHNNNNDGDGSADFSISGVFLTWPLRATFVSAGF